MRGQLLKPLGKMIACSIFAIFTFNGCTGIITGHEYTKSDLVVVYKVVKAGVTTFMTREQIEEARLNKVDLYVTDTYKLIEPVNYTK